MSDDKITISVERYDALLHAKVTLQSIWEVYKAYPEYRLSSMVETLANINGVFRPIPASDDEIGGNNAE